MNKGREIRANSEIDDNNFLTVQRIDKGKLCCLDNGIHRVVVITDAIDAWHP